MERITKVERETGKNGVERAFVNRVKALGGKAYKFTSEANRGVSDRIVTFYGQVWFVEIKRKDTKLSPLQQVFKKQIELLKLNHFVVYGKEGIDEFIYEVNCKTLEE
jgi:hypothetical protein